DAVWAGLVGNVPERREEEGEKNRLDQKKQRHPAHREVDFGGRVGSGAPLGAVPCLSQLQNPPRIAAVGYGMASVVETRGRPVVGGLRIAREALLSTLLGVGVMFLMFVGRPEPFCW